MHKLLHIHWMRSYWIHLWRMNETKDDLNAIQVKFVIVAGFVVVVCGAEFVLLFFNFFFSFSQTQSKRWCDGIVWNIIRARIIFIFSLMRWQLIFSFQCFGIFFVGICLFISFGFHEGSSRSFFPFVVVVIPHVMAMVVRFQNVSPHHSYNLWCCLFPHIFYVHENAFIHKLDKFLHASCLTYSVCLICC